MTKFTCMNEYISSTLLTLLLSHITVWIQRNPKAKIQNIDIEFVEDNDAMLNYWEANIYYDPRIVKDE